MNTLFVSVVLLCSGMDSSREALDSSTVKTPGEKKPYRVGQIFVIGNDRTKMSVILKQLNFYPGQVLSYPDLRLAERNLTRLNIFRNTPDGMIRPTITVVDDPNNPESEFKDIYIKVDEDNTGTAGFQRSLNSKGEWVIRFVVEERNFDPFHFPTSSEDFLSGRAFRGAGLAIGLNFEVTLSVQPVSAPRVSVGIKLPVFP